MPLRPELRGSPSAAAPSRGGPQNFTIHSPRPDYMQERAVLLMWPRKMTEAVIDEVEPNYPRATNRYGITFPTRAAAVQFHKSVRDRPYK